MQSDAVPVRAKPLDDHGLFRQFLHDFYAMRRTLKSHHGDVWQPPTDVYETDDDIVIKVSIAGVEGQHVVVEFNGDVITICGVRRGPDPGSVRTYHQMEIRNGYFERRIILRRPFDAKGAATELREGFLYVYIPKAPELIRHVLTLRLDI